jgi:hypothetical protein
MVKLEVKNLKALREALCVAQSSMSQAYVSNKNETHILTKINRVQELINQIDILRPRGSNGKHGNLHTEFCECDPNPLLELKQTWRALPGYPNYEVSGTGRLRVVYIEDGEEPYTHYPMPKTDEKGREWYTLGIDSSDISHCLSRSNLLEMTFPELKKEN